MILPFSIGLVYPVKFDTAHFRNGGFRVLRRGPWFRDIFLPGDSVTSRVAEPKDSTDQDKTSHSDTNAYFGLCTRCET